MQNILEYITHDYCQGKEICLLFEEPPGDRFWQSHRTLQFATGSTSFDPRSLWGKSVYHRCLQFIAKEPETWAGEITWGAVASRWWGWYSVLWFLAFVCCPPPALIRRWVETPINSYCILERWLQKLQYFQMSIHPGRERLMVNELSFPFQTLE